MSAALVLPHRVAAGGLLWHVEEMGQGPAALLIHGTGASAHSWAGLMPMLAARHRVLAPDLPGMGRTSMPGARDGLGLPGMARALGEALRALDARPRLVVGHSAGAAIAIRMALDGLLRPDVIVAVNGAILPLGGWAGQAFGPLARLMVGLPGVSSLMAWRARDPEAVRRLLEDTGSRLSPAQVDAYARLFREPRHVEATLAMMANWDLPALARDLPRLDVPLLLLAGQQDRTIRPTQARRVQAVLPAARVVMLPGLGHLAHEEDPAAVAEHLP